MRIFHWKKKKLNQKSKKREWLKALFIAFLVLLFLRTFVFQTFSVPNSMMEASLFPGDFVIVNKLSFGTRTPITLLSIPFIGNTIFSKNRSYSDFIQLPYFRLPGFSNIKYNDLICFNYPPETDSPIDKKEVLIKRCVAKPGDTLAITDKKVFVNRKIIENSDDCKFHYRIKFQDSLTPEFLKEHSIHEGGISNELNTYDLFITNKQCFEIEKDSNVLSVNLIKVKKGIQTTPYFPQSNKYNWSKDYFGPVIIPSKGKTIEINIKNIDLYKTIIKNYESNKLEIKNDSIIINDTLSNFYTFKLNYYFVLDDNRDNGKDSRYWGFLPEDHIIGKTSFVWFSIEKFQGSTSVRWNRIFKMI